MAMETCPLRGDDEPGPCPRCGATVSGNDPVRGVCQADFMDKAIGDEIVRLRAQVAAARREALEAAAAKVAPSYKRPCSCESCDCGNIGSAVDVAAWDQATWAAAAIRAMKEAEV